MCKICTYQADLISIEAGFYPATSKRTSRHFLKHSATELLFTNTLEMNSERREVSLFKNNFFISILGNIPKTRFPQNLENKIPWLFHDQICDFPWSLPRSWLSQYLTIKFVNGHFWKSPYLWLFWMQIKVKFSLFPEVGIFFIFHENS